MHGGIDREILDEWEVCYSHFDVRDRLLRRTPFSFDLIVRVDGTCTWIKVQQHKVYRIGNNNWDWSDLCLYIRAGVELRLIIVSTWLG